MSDADLLALKDELEKELLGRDLLGQAIADLEAVQGEHCICEGTEFARRVDPDCPVHGGD